MSVTIIFANGSKQMAHNTDDLRERWELRQQAGQTEIQQESERGYAVPFPSENPSYEELWSLRAEYTAILVAVNARRKMLYPARIFRREHAHLAFVYAEVVSAQAQVKLLLKLMSQGNRFTRVEAERGALWHYSQHLEQLLTELGIELPPEPYEGYRTPRGSTKGNYKLSQDFEEAEKSA